WDVTDSGTPTAQYTFNDNGTYTVKGRVKDKDGGSTTYTTAVSVTNAAPTANSVTNNGPVTAAAPVTSTFNAAPDAAPVAAVAGDTVVVRAGNYAGFVLGWDYPQDGTPTAPITFRADPGAAITSRNGKTPDGIDLEGTSYVVVDGFTVTNDGSIGRAGIRSV